MYGREIAVLRREVDYFRSEYISAILRANVEGYRINDLADHWRNTDTQVELNTEQIKGIKAREVPIMTRQKKEEALQLLSDLAEEMHDIREAQRLLRLDIERLKSREVGSE
jgi:predicted esterase YcpF (UPF0227 family)